MLPLDIDTLHLLYTLREAERELGAARRRLRAVPPFDPSTDAPRRRFPALLSWAGAYLSQVGECMQPLVGWRDYSAPELCSDSLKARCDRTPAAGVAAETLAVEARDVTKRYGTVEALRGVSTSVRVGEVVVLIGPSGSGKSTLLRTINRLEPIDSGQIFINGEPIQTPKSNVNVLRSKVGMVFQQFNLFPHMTVLENITLAPMRVRKLSKADAHDLGLRLLARVGIPEKAAAYPRQLSGGQQQRVAIARSLAMEPSVMLFDEPTSALDPEMVNEVLDVMRKLADDGTTMIVATHEMSFARSAAQRVVFLADGLIVEEGEVGQLFANPQHERTRRFLSHVTAR